MKDILKHLAEDHNDSIDKLIDYSPPLANENFYEGWEMPDRIVKSSEPLNRNKSSSQKRSWDSGTWRGYYV